MEIDIIIKRDNRAKLGLTPEPSNSVPTNREKNNSHIELKGLGSAFSSGYTVTHNMEDSSITILNELPSE